jgi:hypothetical protein
VVYREVCVHGDLGDPCVICRAALHVLATWLEDLDLFMH